jgi:hypothetical protein
MRAATGCLHIQNIWTFCGKTLENQMGYVSGTVLGQSLLSGRKIYLANGKVK